MSGRGSGRDEQELCKIRMFFTGNVVRLKGTPGRVGRSGGKGGGYGWS